MVRPNPGGFAARQVSLVPLSHWSRHNRCSSCSSESATEQRSSLLRATRSGSKSLGNQFTAAAKSSPLLPSGRLEFCTPLAILLPPRPLTILWRARNGGPLPPVRQQLMPVSLWPLLGSVQGLVPLLWVGCLPCSFASRVRMYCAVSFLGRGWHYFHRVVWQNSCSTGNDSHTSPLMFSASCM